MSLSPKCRTYQSAHVRALNDRAAGGAPAREGGSAFVAPSPPNPAQPPRIGQEAPLVGGQGRSARRPWDAVTDFGTLLTAMGTLPGTGSKVVLWLVSVSVALCLALCAPAHADALPWSAPESIDPGIYVSSMSCSSESFCMAVTVEGEAIVFRGTSWSTPAVIAHATLKSVSCASASFCMAVDSAGQSHLYDGSSWSTMGAVDPGGLAAVSCVSSSFCVALGELSTADVYDGSGWRESASIELSAATSVSCVSEAFCAAVNQYGKVAILDGTLWGTPTEIDSGHRLTAVSCRSASFCAAVDDHGNTFTFDGTSWSAPSDVRPLAQLAAVSCASASSCLAMDWNGGTEVYNGSSWATSAEMPGGGGRPAVSCPSASLCVALNGHGNASTFSQGAWSTRVILGGNGLSAVSCTSEAFCIALDGNGRAMTYKGRSWSAPTEVDSTGTLSGLSCVSEAFCAAVDYAGNALIYDGQKWSSPRKIDNESLSGVSCYSALFCVAVGGGERALTFNGTSWRSSGRIDNGGLTAVSCSSASFCTASDGERALIFDGASWSAPTIIGPGSYDAVSCSSASFCVAVSRGASIEGDITTFDGIGWSKPANLDSNGWLTGISCPSSEFCAAVDFTSSLTFDGTSWSAPVKFDENNILTSLSCSSEAFCAAVDGTGRAMIARMPPFDVGPPTIFGAATEGATLTESHGLWRADPTGYRYQWDDCDAAGGNCTPIAGATAQKYTLTGADIGQTIRVQESGANAGGIGGPVFSAPTDPVRSAPSEGPGSAGARIVPVARSGPAWVGGARAWVLVTCDGAPGASCAVALSLATSTMGRDRVHAGKARQRAVGTNSATLGAGETRSVDVPLDAIGLRLLHVRRLLRAELTSSQNGAPLGSYDVTFRMERHKAHGRHPNVRRSQSIRGPMS